MPLKAWVKNALDHVICVCMNEPSLEFVWVGDDAIDPLEQAQTLQILVGAGIKTREEARADLGLAPAVGRRRAKPPTHVAPRPSQREPTSPLIRSAHSATNSTGATVGSKQTQLQCQSRGLPYSNRGLLCPMKVPRPSR